MTSAAPEEVEANSNSDESPSVIESLADELYNAQCKNAIGKDFIPAGALRRVINTNAVRRALQESPTDAGLRAILRDDAERICRSYCKIFAILVLVDMVWRIPDFVSSNVDDSRLPMPDSGTTDARPLPTALLEEGNWNTVTKKWRRRDMDHFKTYQWRVLAPIFIAQDFEYRLCPSHVLPFEESHEQAEGGFGTIYRVKIHPDHHDFGKLGMNPRDSMFAVKEIRRERDHDYYDQEVRILRRFRYRGFSHIIPLLASYEIRIEHDDFSSRRYLIFPWASGDLTAFYKRNEAFPDRTQMILWMAEQSSGLANGLSQIHEDIEHPSSDSQTNAMKDSEMSVFAPDSARMYFRHGDIKPSNILWFDNASSETGNGLGQLVLADFGLAHSHRRNSRSNVTSEAVARSATYRAPEFDTRMKLSRKIDIWSLGCLFLEMLTWLLRGYKVMQDDFCQSRLEESSELSRFFEDTYFRVVLEDGRRIAIIKPSVKAWITDLLGSPRCSPYVRDFLTLVENYMLVVDVEDRIDAQELSHRLRYMYLRCTQDVHYYQEVVNEPTSSSLSTSRMDAAAASEPVQEGAAAHLELADKEKIGPSFTLPPRTFGRRLLGWGSRRVKEKSQQTGQADKPAAPGA